MIQLQTEFFPRKLEESLSLCPTPSQYMDTVRENGRDTIGFLRVLFQREIASLIPTLDYVASVVGSDARFESSGAYEKFEIQLVLKEPSDIEDFSRHLMRNTSGFNEIGCMQFHIINPSVDSVIHFLDSPKQDMHPSRPFDANFIHGNTSSFRDYKEALLNQSKGISFRKLKKRIQAYRAQCRRSLTEPILGYVDLSNGLHFSMVDGISVFSPETYKKGFKYGPLRLTQEGLVNSFLRYSNQFNESPIDLLMSMPHTTPERIIFLQEEGVLSLSQEASQELAEAYMFFLQNYHTSEFQFLRGGNTFIEFDRVTAKEHILNTISITSDSGFTNV